MGDRRHSNRETPLWEVGRSGPRVDADQANCWRECDFPVPILTTSPIPHLHRMFSGSSEGAGMSFDQKRESPTFTFLVVTLISSIAVGDVAKGYLAPSAATGVSCCLIGMAFVAWSRWDLRSKWWFWIALLVGMVLERPLILLLPWAAPHMTGPGAMVFVIPGFVAALGCVFLAEKICSSRST